MYNHIKRIIILLLFSLFCFSKAYGADEQLVDYYLNLIKNSLNEIENYQTPTDNRMYEPKKDTGIEGKSYKIVIFHSMNVFQF